MRNVVARSRYNKERDFHNNLINWLGSILGIGPALGDVYFLASNGGAYEANLLECGVHSDKIFHSFYTAEDALTSGQNDVLCVAPETFTETLETDWDKTRTHVVGMGGPQNAGPDVGTIITTATATVGATIHNTGTCNQFHNITVTNSGAAATALTAFKNAGPGTRLINSQFVGMMGATACDTTLASSLEIAAGGYYFYAEGCTIGTTDYQIQGSDTNAPILFSNTTGGGAPSDGKFYKCSIKTYVAATTRGLIHIASAVAIDRDWLFEKCLFYSFSVNHGFTTAQVVTPTANPSTYDLTFKDCAGINVTDWVTDTNSCIWSSSPDAGTAGGIGVAQT
jgi:hypothetical protein